MHPSAPARDGRFTEVAERTWVARHPDHDLTVTAVEGERGLLVVDTLGSAGAAEAMVEELRRVSSRDVVAVVNTHGHAGHTGGNATVCTRWPAATVHAHEQAGGLDAATFSSVAVVDLGDRVVELVHPGRGHTAGDVVVRVPDVDVLVAGDLVAASGPPSYGPDAFPLDWPAALDFVADLLTHDTVVVPGHGGLLDKELVAAQRGDVGLVAEAIFDAASRSVPLEQAAREGEWPFPEPTVLAALQRGYDQVPRTARRLPLV